MQSVQNFEPPDQFVHAEPVSGELQPITIPSAPSKITALDQHARQRLLERLNLLETIVVSINDVVLITEAEPYNLPGPRIMYVNEAFKRMTGYSAEEVIGKSPRILQGVKTDRAQLDKIRRALEKWEPVRVEMTNYRKDGSEFTVEVSISPIANDQGWYTHWVSVQRETSERKQAEEALNTAHEQLQLANEKLEERVFLRTAELSAANRDLKREIAERRRAEEQLRHHAYHDALTNLPNRSLFIDHLRVTLDRSKRDNRLFAVYFIDLDRFKLVNDSLGHLKGDQLLVGVARRLEKCLRSNDVIARLGGDEFMILVENLHSPSDALRIAASIQQSLQLPLEIGGQELVVTASIGIALSGSGYVQPEAMMRDADTAMYRAKVGGKARYEVFDKEMHTQGVERLKLEGELRRALERDEFRVFYQPIIELKTNRVAGFEALVRWQHPERGLVTPVDFISVAEETGQIVQIGQWVLRESCRQAQIWESKRMLFAPDQAPLTISVNLSCKQFLQPDLAEQVEGALSETGLAANCLKLEITESHMMENSDLAITTMHRLHNLGVELSLDDFGTGYSSLDHLHRLPVSTLKIDRSFINRMAASKEGAQIVQTIVVLAHNLKMKTVAEGIETAEQLEKIKRLGGEYAQGFLFAKPLAASAASRLLTWLPS